MTDLPSFVPSTDLETACVTRSPHIDNDSREQFDIRTHKRLIDILEPTSKTVDALMWLQQTISRAI